MKFKNLEKIEDILHEFAGVIDYEHSEVGDLIELYPAIKYAYAKKIKDLMNTLLDELEKSIKDMKDIHYEGDDCDNCGIKNCCFEEECSSPKNQTLSEIDSKIKKLRDWLK